METAICRPWVDALSPHCRCLRCETQRALMPFFPRAVSLQLSPDRGEIVIVNIAERWEIWRGPREPATLRRAWMAPAGHVFELPVFSPDGAGLCVPLLGDEPGLHLLPVEGPPLRLTRGHDVEPRWLCDGITFYRVEARGTQALRVPLAPADGTAWASSTPPAAALPPVPAAPAA